MFSPFSNVHLRQPSLPRQLRDAVLAVAFPTDCFLCGSELSGYGGPRVCRTCWSRFEPWPGPACTRCGLPFPSSHALDSSLAECGSCRNDAPAFDGARTFGLYTGQLRQVILRLKFAGDERLGVPLGALLASTYAALLQIGALAAPVIVPVPLHASRRRERGFNQSELLAAGLLWALKKQASGVTPTVATGCLRRKRLTPPQTGLSVAARRENLRGAFEVAKPEKVRGRGIVLVDDVITTGATLSACARALKRAGAMRVLGLALARATPQFPDLDIVTANAHGQSAA